MRTALQSWLRSWGVGLGDEDQARALAAAGMPWVIDVARGARGAASPAPSPRDHGTTWSWNWPQLAGHVDAAALAAGWRDVQAQHPSIRIAIERTAEPIAGGSFAVQRILGSAAVVGSGAAHVALPSPGDTAPWRWPLDIATTTEETCARVVQALQTAPWSSKLFRVRRLGARHWRASLLVLGRALDDAMREAEELHPSTRAAAVLVLGACPPSDARTAGIVDLIARRTHARAVIICAAEDWRCFLPAFLAELSHDAPLDFALARAARGSDELVIAGDLGAFAGKRLSMRLPEAMRDRASLDAHVAGGVRGVPHLGGAAPPELDRVRGAAIAHAMPPESWRHEGDAATLLVEIEDAVAQASAVQPRFLLSRVAAPGGSEKLAALSREHDYEVQVRVGPRDEAFLELATPVAGLPVSDRCERLAVLFTDPVLAPIPQLAWLDLPPIGPTATCRFAIHTTATTERLDARVTLLHDGRVLQTGVLRAICDGRSPITFSHEATPRVQLATLDERHHFGAALIANHNDDDVPGFIAATAEGKAARLALSDGDVKALTAALGVAFDTVKDDPRPLRSLRDASSVSALRNLAEHGAAFHAALVRDNAVGAALLQRDPIQVVNARASAFLPIELAYRWPTPADDAELCRHAEEALTSGSGECPHACGGGTQARVCPLGFWGLSRVIERVSYRPWELGGVGDFGLSVEPLRGRSQLYRPRTAVLAASDQAKVRLASCVDDLAASLAATLGVEPPVPVPTWNAWIEAVQDVKAWPPLLVLVPHHERKEDFELLEIGKNTMKSVHVTTAHVLGKHVAETDPRPIVLLLGCETVLSEISFESFVTAFRDSGAAVVVGTIATVLGLDAAPVAGELAHAIVAEYGAAPPRSLGDVMLRVRRRLVAAGRVMALALAANGDADWVLT